MPTSYELKLNIEQINNAAELAFRDTAFLLSREFTRVISQPRDWQGYGVRDIVDTGQLRASQQLVFNGTFSATFSWNTEYAAEVHEGLTLRNGRVLSGRPWTAIALQEFDVQAAYAKSYRTYSR